MTPQFPAAGKWQFATQFDILGAATRQLIESTEQVIALNIDTSRTAFERSANAFRQLLAMKDPRDLLVLGGQSEEQFQQMLAYTRELFTIATEAQAKLARQAGAVAGVAPDVATPGCAGPAAAQQAAPAAPQQAAPAAPQETAVSGAGTEPAPRRARPGRKPVVEAGTQAAPEPAAKANPIATAASKVAPQPAAERHPLAAPVAAGGAVELPPVKPVEAAPPPAPASGTPEIDARQAQRAAIKGARKK